MRGWIRPHQGVRLSAEKRTRNGGGGGGGMEGGEKVRKNGMRGELKKYRRGATFRSRPGTDRNQACPMRQFLSPRCLKNAAIEEKKGVPPKTFPRERSHLNPCAQQLPVVYTTAGSLYRCV